ncbi:magnesium transporter, partial [Bacteroidia bacterium]|nr:magnesium transporter [Bacteroidia bacterium]
MSAIEITKESVNELIELIDTRNQVELIPLLEKLFPADIAEIFDDIGLDQAVYLASLLEPQIKVVVLTELEADVKLKFLSGYTTEEIANDFIAFVDSDDAADILNSMDGNQGKEILRKISDKEHSK